MVIKFLQIFETYKKRGKTSRLCNGITLYNSYVIGEETRELERSMGGLTALLWGSMCVGQACVLPLMESFTWAVITLALTTSSCDLAFFIHFQCHITPYF